MYDSACKLEKSKLRITTENEYKSIMVCKSPLMKTVLMSSIFTYNLSNLFTFYEYFLLISTPACLILLYFLPFHNKIFVYERLYSSAVFNEDFVKFSPAEITRRPVDDLILQMKVNHSLLVFANPEVCNYNLCMICFSDGLYRMLHSFLCMVQFFHSNDLAGSLHTLVLSRFLFVWRDHWPGFLQQFCVISYSFALIQQLYIFHWHNFYFWSCLSILFIDHNPSGLSTMMHAESVKWYPNIKWYE